jgi:hypothetical protein
MNTYNPQLAVVRKERSRFRSLFDKIISVGYESISLKVKKISREAAKDAKEIFNS